MVIDRVLDPNEGRVRYLGWIGLRVRPGSVYG